MFVLTQGTTSLQSMSRELQNTLFNKSIYTNTVYKNGMVCVCLFLNHFKNSWTDWHENVQEHSLLSWLTLRPIFVLIFHSLLRWWLLKWCPYTFHFMTFFPKMETTGRAVKLLMPHGSVQTKIFYKEFVCILFLFLTQFTSKLYMTT